MTDRTVGFIGGGRVTRILLGGFQRAGALPRRIVVSDTDAVVLDDLRGRFPGIETVGADVSAPAGAGLVFGALHPPDLGPALPEIRRHLRPESIFISLAPKLTLAALAAGLAGFARVVRLIPNAASILCAGFNPISLSPAVAGEERAGLLRWFAALGDAPEVPEEELEAYAILTAMGPTYFWYQFQELAEVGCSFGLRREAVEQALPRMLEGAVRTYFSSGLTPDQVMDLIPVKPLEAAEGQVREVYRTKLAALHEKLKS
jgi:pyrroline-5-carboxylate reductase